ncbi:hypothetical protein ARMGADRAFT_1035674 [Armillaria gallica]|uniref:Uncharacterized protein n=1 Tax=Armillaria gallica TaxID=47427 RepID=A0A2H3CT28_ARMGA|nr:hypothetical protein ARMGADRAFT_1035674 [Armillaria gallica]
MYSSLLSLKSFILSFLHLCKLHTTHWKMSALPKNKKTKAMKSLPPPVTRVLRDRETLKKPTEQLFLPSDVQMNAANVANVARNQFFMRTRSLDREIEEEGGEREKPDEIDNWNDVDEFEVSDGTLSIPAQTGPWNKVTQAETAAAPMLEARVTAAKGKGRDPAEGPSILKKALPKCQMMQAKQGAYTQIERTVQPEIFEISSSPMVTQPQKYIFQAIQPQPYAKADALTVDAFFTEVKCDNIKQLIHKFNQYKTFTTNRGFQPTKLTNSGPSHNRGVGPSSADTSKLERNRDPSQILLPEEVTQNLNKGMPKY